MQKSPPSPAVTFEAVTLCYPNHVRALNQLTFTVQPGDFYGLLGVNGAGKSSAISIMCGLVRKTSGSIKLFGYDIDQDSMQAKRLIGVMPQGFNFHPFEQTRAILLQQGGYYGLPSIPLKRKVDYLLETLQLTHKASARAGSLSGGMKRKLLLARALVHSPQLLILDEPSAGVDIEARQQLWTFLTSLNRAGTTLILTTHYLEEAEKLCSRLGILKEGQLLAEGKTHTLLQTVTKRHFLLEIVPQTAAVNTHFAIPGFQWYRVDKNRIEITLGEAAPTLTEIFAKLGAQGIQVTGIHQVSPRLEALFLSLTQAVDPARQTSIGP